MFEKFYKYFLYTSLYHQIKDSEIRNYFYEFTKSKYQRWDAVIFNKLFQIINKRYIDIEKTVSNFSYISYPEILILFIKDDYMLAILEKYKKNKKYKNNYKFIYNKIHVMYPERF
jgi:hypothetical protein